MRRSRSPLFPALFGIMAVGACCALASGCSSSGDSHTPDGGQLADANTDAPSVDATTPDASGANDAGGSEPDAGARDGAAAVDAAGDATVDAESDAGDGGAGDEGDAGDCLVGDAGEPLDLRCTGLYSDWATKSVAPGTLEFEPGVRLWSDGAVKTRWIRLPPTANDGAAPQPIDTSNMDEWTFPIGTKFWKEFVLGGKRIETRLLWKQSASTWYRTTYRWSADGSSAATELTEGELDADGDGYEVPSQPACSTCHNGRLDGVLGFEAVSLALADAGQITLQTLSAQGWMTNAPDAAIVIPGNALDVAALGYLHANCGTACHNRGSGEAHSTGFFMRLEVGRLASVTTTDPWVTGVNQPSYVQPPGASAPLELLAPGDAGASCVAYRMSHRSGVDGTGAGIQMPPIDTHKVDEAGVALIEQWINAGCQ